MSVQNQINRITTNIANTYDELENLGATMPAVENSDNLASTAASIGSVLDLKEDKANKSDSYTESSSTTYSSTKALVDGLSTKQATLVSGTNIKTLNNDSILGEGNLDIQGVKVQDTAPENPKTGDVWIDTSMAGTSPGEIDSAISAHNSSASAHSSLLTGKEDTSNKVTSITSSSTDVEYPSAKAVYDALSGVGDFAVIKCTASSSTCTTYSQTYTELITNSKKPIIEIVPRLSSYKAKYYYPAYWQFNNSSKKFEIYVFDDGMSGATRWSMGQNDTYWTDSWGDAYLDTGDIATSISSSSTNSKVPGALATYNAVNAKETKGYITFGSTTYELELTETDPGAPVAGKFVFVVEPV